MDAHGISWSLTCLGLGGERFVAHSVYQKWLDIFPKTRNIFFDCRQPVMLKMNVFLVAPLESLGGWGCRVIFCTLFSIMRRVLPAHTRSNHECAIAPSVTHVRFQLSRVRHCSTMIVLCDSWRRLDGTLCGGQAMEPQPKEQFALVNVGVLLFRFQAPSTITSARGRPRDSLRAAMLAMDCRSWASTLFTTAPVPWCIATCRKRQCEGPSRLPHRWILSQAQHSLCCRAPNPFSGMCQSPWPSPHELPHTA